MAEEFDLTPHLETWHAFLHFIFWGAAGIATILVVLALAFL